MGLLKAIYVATARQAWTGWMRVFLQMTTWWQYRVNCSMGSQFSTEDTDVEIVCSAQTVFCPHEHS